MIRPPTLILASGSPRRAAVLHQLGLEFLTCPTGVDETLRADETPARAAERLARAKAAAGRRDAGRRAKEGPMLSLGFDTLVAHRGEWLGKPRSTDEAAAMIARLGGEEHEVFTGIAIAGTDRIESAVERTCVRFRPLSDEDIEAYIATGEPMDKAGAYGIQGVGAALVASVRGDFFNVMGFPVQRFQELLTRFGWRYGFGTGLVADGPTPSSGPPPHDQELP